MKEERFYRLWIEYLKRSEDYKEFCEIIRKKRKNPSLPIPDKFKHSGTRYPANGYRFGDIFDKRWTFKEWWKYHKKKAAFHNGYPVEYYCARRILQIKGEFIPNDIVEDYAEYFQRDMDICIQQFKFYNKRKEPTLSEFKECFLYHLKQGHLSQYITIRIDPRRETTEDILKQVKKIIREKRKEPQVRKREYDFIAHLKPSTRLRLDELEKYLKVYDLKEKELKPKEVIKSINPNDDTNNEAVQRAYRDFYDKAKKIIWFTERGIFPGPYDKIPLKKLFSPRANELKPQKAER
ncbi:MAG TPA: hypothetical protein DD725_06025 [Deltaproteobacteria bacterium]|nr:hypothetical protein [Deltaproteobacteria bacterium]